MNAFVVAGDNRASSASEWMGVPPDHFRATPAITLGVLG